MIGSRDHEAGAKPEERASYLTSMVDVLFMLLVFLILTANAAHYQITVDLPEASPSEALDPDAWLIEDRGSDEGWAFEGETYQALDRLAARVRDRLADQPDPMLTVAVDATTKAQRLIEMLEALNRTGVEDVRIATQAGRQ